MKLTDSVRGLAVARTAKATVKKLVSFMLTMKLGNGKGVGLVWWNCLAMVEMIN